MSETERRNTEGIVEFATRWLQEMPHKTQFTLTRQQLAKLLEEIHAFRRGPCPGGTIAETRVQTLMSSPWDGAGR
jgi:hypothetical protein